MGYNYRVYVRTTPTSSWRDTGIIESHKPTAETVWTDIIRKLRYHAYRLEPIAYGIPVQRT